MRNWKIVVILLVVSSCYIILGGIVFHFLEKDEAKSHKEDIAHIRSQFLGNHTCITEDELGDLFEAVITAYNDGVVTLRGEGRSSKDNGWSIHKSIYFASTIVSTIGYGNIAPVTSGGRAFTVIFALIGIPMALLVYAKVGKLVNQGLARLMSRCFKDGKSTKAKIIRSLTSALGGTILFIIIPPTFFMQKEDWTYGEGCYYSFITLSTIGLGDFVAGFDGASVEYNFMVALWILVGLVWMSSVVSSANELYERSVSKVFHADDTKEPPEDMSNSDADAENVNQSAPGSPQKYLTPSNQPIDRKQQADTLISETEKL